MYTCRYRRYGGLYKTVLLGMPVHFVFDLSAVRLLFRGEGNTFAVPFYSFKKLVGDVSHLNDGPLHQYFVSMAIPVDGYCTSLTL